MADLVKMYKPNPAPGTPGSADVHPDEVTNMQAGGWLVAEAEEGDTARQEDATDKKAKK